ncbi:MAG: alpha/beta hydrolase [Ruminococcus sp.]|nr:alpha/beta hydrolase [Ruminococcus sp.]
MKIKLIGKRENPAVVLIHGVFCDYKSVMHFAEYLQDDFFLVLPTLDGHYPDSKDYTTAAKQARILSVALRRMGIEKIAMIHGTSMGAAVALEMAEVCDIPTDNYFFDAGTFFRLTGVYSNIMYKKFVILSHKFRNPNADELMQKRFVRRLCGGNTENYSDTISSVINTLDFMTENTVKNVFNTCFNCRLPHFDNETAEKFIFHFSDKEPVHRCRKRLKKRYPSAHFSDYPGRDYCGFQTNEPELYAQFLKDIIDNCAEI